MPKAFSESEREWISERLLEAGHKQFAAFGLKKTSVEELAEAARISKGAFYLFYESKEALFMDVVERAEIQFREKILAEVDRPGRSPRARLVALLRKAFTAWKTVPVLQVFTRGDYQSLAGRIPAAQREEHLQGDREFIRRLVARCRSAGIPIQARAEEMDELMHALFFVALHEDDLGPQSLENAQNILLELVAAYCLGEVNLQAHGLVPDRRKRDGRR
jgi:AcrR family transcriptional regulator